MKLAKVWMACVVICVQTVVLIAQSSPDVENGFKNYGSYHGSDIDTVDLKSGNLMVHIPMPWTYPQRGSAIAPHNLLTVSSKSWTTSCNSGTITMDGVEPGSGCWWTPGIWRDQQVSLMGTGLGFDHTMDVSIHRTWGYQTDTANNVFYFSSGYTVATPDGGTHAMVASPGAALDPNGDPMAYDARDASGFHVDLSDPDSTDGTPDTAIATDRHGNRYAGSWVTQPNCRAVFDNGLIGGSSSKSCGQAIRLSSITDVNGNVFASGNDTLGRPFHSFSFVSSGPDTTGCVLNGLPFSSSTIESYAGPNGATNQVKLCYGTVTVSTAFGVSGVTEAQNKPGLTGPLQATVLATIILPDNNNAISVNSPKWVFNYDSYINLTYIGLPTGGSISYSWQTLNLGFPCNKISRVVASRTFNDNNGHSSIWNYFWGQPVAGSLAQISNRVTDPLGNDTVHVFTDPAGRGTCLQYETQTQQFQGSSASGQLLKQVDTTYMASTIGYVVPTNIQTTLFPANKVSLVTRSYDSGLGTGFPIFGNVVSEKEYDWGQGAPGALLRETDTTYQWQIDSRYLTARLLDLPASVIVKDGGGNRQAETDNTYDEAAYITGYEATVGALPAGTHIAAPNPVRGLQTTVSRWLNTTNSFIVSHTNWYDTGEPHQSIDPLGHTSTNSYNAVYAGAYSTQTCSPSTGSTAHCVSGTYDFQTGALTSLTNENATAQASGNTPGDQAHTSNFSYDSMGRLTLAQSPPDPANSGARAQTSLTFSVPNTFPLSVQRTKSITTALSDSATNFFDGLGRMYQDQHTLPNGTAKVDTAYDAQSRETSVSNPYFTTSDATYGVTQTLYDALGRAYQTTKQDGSASSVDYSSGNCTLTTDEAGHQRKGCSDALGRLIEVDEPNPNAIAHVVINGHEQANAQPVVPGTGWVTIGGREGSVVVCPFGHCHTAWDAGSVTVTINGYSQNASYSQFGSTTAAALASALAGAFQQDPNSPVNASIDPSNSAKINFTSRSQTLAGNYSLAASVTSSDPTDFDPPSFSTTQSGPSLTGGRDATTNPDTGSVTIVVNGVGYSTSFGGADSDGSGIASRLASLVSAGPYANATASGVTVSLTSKTSGPSGNYSLSASYTWNSASFAQPSFTTSSDVAMSAISNSPYATVYQYDALGNLLRVDQKGSAPNDSTQWRTRTFTYDSLSRLLTANNPESGTITYAYDSDGNLLQKASPAPNQTGTATQTVSYCYDALHRVTGKGYGAQNCPLASPVVTYTYDSGANAKGKLTSLADQAGTASYTYDILGRLTAETRPIAGVSKSTSYSYNLDGSVKTLTYPSGRVVTYTPDSAGRLVSAVDGNGTSYVSNATYYASGAEFQRWMPGIYFSTTLNNRLQVSSLYSDNGQIGAYFTSKTYNYGPLHQNNGNVMSITNNKDPNRTQTFTYDALNRLASGWSSANTGTYSWGENYSIDAWGNLQISPMGTKAHGGTFQLSGNAQNRPTGMNYDAAGNLMSYVSATYAYDQENRLSSTAGMSYTYDGNGERVLKSNTSTGAAMKRYWSMGGNTLAESDGSGNLTAEYIYFGGKRVARIDLPANTVHYYLSDHLGSTSIVASSAGAIEEESDYYPFGTEVNVTGPGLNELKFTGKRRDAESQLNYFGARYYSNGLGRFITPDWAAMATTVPYADLSDPQSLNLYSYVRNRPTSLVDPNGHKDGPSCSGLSNCTVSTRTDNLVIQMEHYVWVVTSTTTQASGTDENGHKVERSETTRTDSAYSRDAGHEGQFLGSRQQSTGVVQQTYDQHQTLANTSGTTPLTLSPEVASHTITASAASSAIGGGGMSEMIDATRPGLIGGAFKAAANDPHALVHAGAAVGGGICLITPCSAAVGAGLFFVESANFLWEKLEK